MLTSYHYLLGGIMTVSCATGSVAHSVAVSQMSPISFEQRQRELIQVSDRGSGRLGGNPANTQEPGEEALTTVPWSIGSFASILSRASI
ncbi:hypothetical protein [Leptolyngbya sp. BC1307]|uniref:hypothetical protein n=1 Tax=Leptolyngbya sp. BC1307 TaxID=2029589 RepID=UPI000EFA3B10|nr:hypothetical protein [Leptolyngbya sp. BC1307]